MPTYGSFSTFQNPGMNDDETSGEVYVTQTPINVVDESETSTLIVKGNDGKANVFSVSFSLIQTSVGAGMLSLPYAFKSMGLVLAILFTIFVAAISFYTLWLTIKASTAVNEYSFKGIANKTLGRFAGPTFEVSFSKINFSVFCISNLFWCSNSLPYHYRTIITSTFSSVVRT